MAENKKKDYSNGKIYKIEPICDYDEGDIYIGSTSQKYISQRFRNHKSNYNQWKLGKSNNTTAYNLFEKYGADNCQIVLIEKVECNTKDELYSREAFYIRTLKCINKHIPLRTDKEYYDENRELIINKHKIYRENNKETRKIYIEKNRDAINERRRIKYH